MVIDDRKYTVTLLDLTVEGKGYIVFAFQNEDDFINNRPPKTYRNIYITQVSTGQTVGPFSTAYDAMIAVNHPGFKDTLTTPAIPIAVQPFVPPDFSDVIHVDFITKKRLNIRLLK